MPAPVAADRVDDVEVEQVDLLVGKALVQGPLKIAVIVVAQSAAGALGVDDDRDRPVRPRRRGDLGQMGGRVAQFERKVNAHNATQCAAVDGHQDERFSGTKPSTAGSAAISAPGRLSWKSDCDVVMPRRWAPWTTCGRQNGATAVALWMNSGLGITG